MMQKSRLKVFRRPLSMASLPAQKQGVQFFEAELHPGGAAVVALVAARGVLHVAKERIHFGQSELAAGAHGAVAGHGA